MKQMKGFTIESGRKRPPVLGWVHPCTHPKTKTPPSYTDGRWRDCDKGLNKEKELFYRYINIFTATLSSMGVFGFMSNIVKVFIWRSLLG